MVRLFIGVLVPEEIKRPVAEAQESLARMPMVLKLVEAENIHVTLAFLGEVPDDKVPETAALLDFACAPHRKFTAKVGAVSLIPSEAYIRAVAFDVTSSGDAFESLRKDVASKLGGDSHPVHLTTARVKEVRDRSFVKNRVRGMSIDRYFEVSSVCLMRSVMSRSGPVYEVIHESRLGD